MADDAGIAEQALDILIAEIRDPVKLEIFEGLTEVLALAQDGEPRKPRLETLEAYLLEQTPVVRDRTAPLVVVIVTVKPVIAMPEAARPPIFARNQSGLFFVHVKIFLFGAAVATRFTLALPD